jgi:hypothetical protein
VVFFTADDKATFFGERAERGENMQDVVTHGLVYCMRCRPASSRASKR